ncbi:MAG TPA: YajG family lipoprotein [Candidatus Limnocylindria bacterium]|nr:YajG family lipoprotein [Candidatus Limnocylindria bacterium]
MKFSDFRCLISRKQLPACLTMMLLGVLATGCAFTKTPVTVNFGPNVQEPLTAAASSTLQVGKVRDSRPVNDPAVLVQKRNGYGQVTSGSYIAQKPVAELLRDGLASTLRANGFNPGNSASKYELRGDLQEFDFDVISGFWTAEVKPKVMLRFELVELATGKPVWRETYVGRHTAKTGWGDSVFIVDMFNKAAENALKQLLEDNAFRAYFQ